MLLLSLLIISGFFNLPAISITESTFQMSLGSTCVSIYLTLSKLKTLSQALEEDLLEYMLICLKSKYGWIPFGRKLEKNALIKDIHFGPVELVKQSGLDTTITTGKYISMNYRFTEQNLQTLNTHLATAALTKVHISDVEEDEDIKEFNE